MRIEARPESVWMSSIYRVRVILCREEWAKGCESKSWAIKFETAVLVENPCGNAPSNVVLEFSPAFKTCRDGRDSR